MAKVKASKNGVWLYGRPPEPLCEPRHERCVGPVKCYVLDQEPEEVLRMCLKHARFAGRGMKNPKLIELTNEEAVAMEVMVR